MGRISIKTCILPYVKQMTNANLMNEAGHLRLVLWDNQRDRVEKEVGGGVQDCGTHVHSWLLHVDVRQKPPQNCKAVSLQLK